MPKVTSSGLAGLQGCLCWQVYFRESLLKASFGDTCLHYLNSRLTILSFFFSHALPFLLPVSIADRRIKSFYGEHFGPIQVHEFCKYVVVRATGASKFYYTVTIHRVASI